MSTSANSTLAVLRTAVFIKRGEYSVLDINPYKSGKGYNPVIRNSDFIA